MTSDGNLHAMRRVAELRATARRRAKQGGPDAWASAINAQSLDRIMSTMPANRALGTGRPRRVRRAPQSVQDRILSSPIFWAVVGASKIVIVVGILLAIAHGWSCRA